MGKKETDDQLHVLFFPFPSPSHLTQAIDIAKLFASRGQRSTFITTAHFAELLSKSGSNIDVVTIKVPTLEVGLPEDVDSFQKATTLEFKHLFIKACSLLAPQLEEIMSRLRPDCLVPDVLFPWAFRLAAGLGIPVLVFGGGSFFARCAQISISIHKPHAKAASDSDAFTVPDLPDEVKLMRGMIPGYLVADDGSAMVRFFKEIEEMRGKCYGFLRNSFYELEGPYVDCLREVFGKKGWPIGPLFLHERKDGAEMEAHECLKWLDSKMPNSVVYVCFGSLAEFGDEQLLEIAAGLEASGQQFIWAVRREDRGAREEKWLPEGFEERMEGRGLVIRGWAPQVPILEHKAVGGFVTHCGWNSTLESVCAGVPMLTWPMAAEQFYNEKLVSQVLRIGVEVGAKKWKILVGDFVRREALEKGVRRLMGEEGEEMRGRVRGFAEMARKAVQEGGSSMLNLDNFFQDLRSRRIAGKDTVFDSKASRLASPGE